MRGTKFLQKFQLQILLKNSRWLPRCGCFDKWLMVRPVHYVALHCRSITTQFSLAHKQFNRHCAQLLTILLCIGNDQNLLEVQPKHSHIKRTRSEFGPIKLSRPKVIKCTAGMAFNLHSLDRRFPNKWISSSVDDVGGKKVSGLDQIGDEPICYPARPPPWDSWTPTSVWNACAQIPTSLAMIRNQNLTIVRYQP